jgi:hypothetical protein
MADRVDFELADEWTTLSPDVARRRHNRPSEAIIEKIRPVEGAHPWTNRFQAELNVSGS